MQIVETQSLAVEHAGAIVGQQHVVAAHQPLDDFDRFGLPEVERNAALATIHRDEIVRDLGILRFRSPDHFGKHPAAGVAGSALFDFGDARAEVGEKQRRKRTLDLLTNLQDLDSFKRLRHLNSPWQAAEKELPQPAPSLLSLPGDSQEE